MTGARGGSGGTQPDNDRGPDAGTFVGLLADVGFLERRDDFYRRSGGTVDVD